MTDPVEHPAHYNAHPSGVECIQITEHMNFCLGNAIKYIWRAGLKPNSHDDLAKAKWYLEREIARKKPHREVQIEVAKKYCLELLALKGNSFEINQLAEKIHYVLS